MSSQCSGEIAQLRRLIGLWLFAYAIGTTLLWGGSDYGVQISSRILTITLASLFVFVGHWHRLQVQIRHSRTIKIWIKNEKYTKYTFHWKWTDQYNWWEWEIPFDNNGLIASPNILIIIHKVINKGYFSEVFLFKPREGRSPPSGLNRKPRENPLFSL